MWQTGSFTLSTAHFGGFDTDIYCSAWADIDSDGDLDLFVGGKGPNFLWVNDGLGSFTAATGGPVGGSSHTRTVAWADIDGDGDQDLFVGNHISVADCGATICGNELWLNDGNGQFTLKNDTWLWREPSQYHAGVFKTTSAAFGDVDGDGDLDLYIGVFGEANELFLNDGT